MNRNAITIGLALAALLAGSPGEIMPKRFEVTRTQPAVMMGIDRADDGRVKVTLLLSHAEDTDGGEGGQGGHEGGEDVVSAEARSVSMALAKIREKLLMEVPISSIENFLLGESAVRSDFRVLVDLLSKDSNLRFIAQVYVVKDAQTEDVIKAIAESGYKEAFGALGEDSGLAHLSSKMEFIQFLQYACDRDASFTIPTVHLEKNGEGSQVAVTEGYAIFSQGKFAGFIEPADARAYNLLTGKSVRSVLEVPWRDGNVLGMMLETASTEVKFEFDANALRQVNVTVEFASDALDVGAVPELRDPKTIKEIEAKQSALILDEVYRMIELAKSLESDVLGIGEQMRMYHPYYWHKIEPTWPEVFGETQFHITVHSCLRHSFDMIQLPGLEEST